MGTRKGVSRQTTGGHPVGTCEMKHCPSDVAAKKKTIAIQTQIGNPANVCRVFFFSGSGFGNSVWQRQQTSLSSGFHVPHFGQSIARSLFWQICKIVSQIRAAGKGFMCICVGIGHTNGRCADSIAAAILSRRQRGAPESGARGAGSAAILAAKEQVRMPVKLPCSNASAELPAISWAILYTWIAQEFW